MKQDTKPNGKIKGFVRRYPKAIVTTLVVGAVLFGFVMYYFQPWKLFVNSTVKESGPAPGAATLVASGMFKSLEHSTTGEASLLRMSDGSTILRFDNLKTSNGPVLKVYLSEQPATLGQGDYGKKFLDLGGLKGNIGSQNYRIPAGTDLTKYQSVVIWCARFSVGFGVAPLTPGS